jgi:hypothetical protein
MLAFCSAADQLGIILRSELHEVSKVEVLMSS